MSSRGLFKVIPVFFNQMRLYWDFYVTAIDPAQLHLAHNSVMESEIIPIYLNLKKDGG